MYSYSYRYSYSYSYNYSDSHSYSCNYGYALYEHAVEILSLRAACCTSFSLHEHESDDTLRAPVLCLLAVETPMPGCMVCRGYLSVPVLWFPGAGFGPACFVTRQPSGIYIYIYIYMYTHMYIIVYHSIVYLCSRFGSLRGAHSRLGGQSKQ